VPTCSFGRAKDVSLQPLVLSLRQLLQLGRRCQQRPGAEVVQAALSGYLHFLPPLSKQAVQRMMQQAMKGGAAQLRRS
jgi:hypothetical protein